ncbi:hypothetical protein [Streptomyces sp. SM12]|uniref:hypothetical protein n=1 Tax=Streptomyces sp. SM12 TaxID=1071602 RepID=UPI000CD55145|nr:hypothetical protein [Streptomyces sp. SM12]
MEIILIACALAWTAGAQTEQTKLGLSPAERAAMREQTRHERAVQYIADNHGKPAAATAAAPPRKSDALVRSDAPAGPSTLPEAFRSGYRGRTVLERVSTPMGRRAGTLAARSVTWAQDTGRGAVRAYRERRIAAGAADPAPVMVPAPPTKPPTVPPPPTAPPTEAPAAGSAPEGADGASEGPEGAPAMPERPEKREEPQGAVQGPSLDDWLDSWKGVLKTPRRRSEQPEQGADSAPPADLPGGGPEPAATEQRRKQEEGKTPESHRRRRARNDKIAAARDGAEKPVTNSVTQPAGVEPEDPGPTQPGVTRTGGRGVPVTQPAREGVTETGGRDRAVAVPAQPGVTQAGGRGRSVTPLPRLEKATGTEQAPAASPGVTDDETRDGPVTPAAPVAAGDTPPVTNTPAPARPAETEPSGRDSSVTAPHDLTKTTVTEADTSASVTAPTQKTEGSDMAAAEVSYESVMEESDALSVLCTEDLAVYDRIRTRAEREVARGEKLLAELRQVDSKGVTIPRWITSGIERYQVIASLMEQLSTGTLAQKEAVAQAKALLEAGQGVYASEAADMESVGEREFYLDDTVDSEDTSADQETFERAGA